MNAKTTDERIDAIIVAMGQEDELMLHRLESDHLEYKWSLHIGNPSGCVCLGDVDGILVFEGDSIENVLNQAEAHFLLDR